jgi:hypothetical protein
MNRLNFACARWPVPHTTKNGTNVSEQCVPRTFIVNAMLKKYHLLGDVILCKTSNTSTKPSITSITPRNQFITANMDVNDRLIQERFVQTNQLR